MTQIAQSRQLQQNAQELPISGQKFDWLVIMTTIWFIGGLFVDGWAHNNGRVDDSFFTPYHAVFYSGFLAVAIVHLFATYKNHQAGLSWQAAIPQGYVLSLAGLAIFAVGGVGDMIWHETFGIEEGTAALLSPTHLMLGIGMGLITTGPIRAAGQRKDESKMPFTVLIATAVFISLATFMTQYAYFFDAASKIMTGRPPTNGFLYDISHVAGVDGGLITTAIFMSIFFIIMRRWQLPTGTFTAIFFINGLLMGYMFMELLLVFLLPIVGVMVDILFALLRPSSANPKGIRLFALMTPIIFLLAYTVAIELLYGSWWEIHFQTGIPVLAALGSLCLSYMVFPSTSIEPLAD